MSRVYSQLIHVPNSWAFIDAQENNVLMYGEVLCGTLSSEICSLHKFCADCAAGMVDSERIVLKAIFPGFGRVRFCRWTYCPFRDGIWRIAPLIIWRMTSDAQNSLKGPASLSIIMKLLTIIAVSFGHDIPS